MWGWLLAQTSNLTTGGIAVGSGAAMAGVITLLTRRSVNRVMDHVDDDKKHVNPNNGYVTQSVCEERQKLMNERHDDIKEDLGYIRQAVDDIKRNGKAAGR